MHEIFNCKLLVRMRACVRACVRAGAAIFVRSGAEGPWKMCAGAFVKHFFVPDVHAHVRTSILHFFTIES